MPLKKLGRPPFLNVNEVMNDDLLEVLEPPYIVPAEKMKWGRARGRAIVKIVRTNEVRTWTMNVTTWDRLIDEFGTDPDHWVGKKIRLSIEKQVVRGEDKLVLYGKPYHELQQQLPATATANLKPTVEDDIAQRIAKLSPESKTALLEKFKEKVA